jgi:hypothetical protein
VSGQPEDSQAVVTREADRSQANYFYDELHRQINLLDEQAEVFSEALTTYLRRGEHRQAQRMRRELRLSAMERRNLLDMLSALTRRFPRDQTATRSVAGTRHRVTSSPASLNRTGGQAKAGVPSA